MHSLIKIKVKISNKGENADKLICLRALTFFQIESHDHENGGLMASSVVLLMMES